MVQFLNKLLLSTYNTALQRRQHYVDLHVVGIAISMIQHLELAGSSSIITICSTNSKMKSKDDLDWEFEQSELLTYEDPFLHESIAPNVSLVCFAMIGIAGNIARFVATQAGREAMEVAGQN